MSDPHDPKGLMREAFRMDLGDADCRALFLDWALGVADPRGSVPVLLDRHDPAHPMAVVLRAALAAPPPGGRRGGRRARAP